MALVLVQLVDSLDLSSVDHLKGVIINAINTIGKSHYE